MIQLEHAVYVPLSVYTSGNSWLVSNQWFALNFCQDNKLDPLKAKQSHTGLCAPVQHLLCGHVFYFLLVALSTSTFLTPPQQTAFWSVVGYLVASETNSVGFAWG